MKQQNKENFLNFIGVLLLFFFVIRLACLIRDGVPQDVFWICNHAPLILGVAILFRNSFWITAEISFALTGVAIWTTDYLTKVLFGFHIFGSTEYLFPIGDLPFFVVTSLIHFFSLPLAFSALYLINKQEPRAWKGALLQAIILIPPVIYFGKEYNLNCFLEPCISWLPNFTLYPIFLLIGYFLLFVIPINKGIVKILKIFKKNQ